jgi:hypothetical protein
MFSNQFDAFTCWGIEVGYYNFLDKKDLTIGIFAY